MPRRSCEHVWSFSVPDSRKCTVRNPEQNSPDGHFGNDDAVLVERGPHELAEAVVVVHVGDDGELADLLERLEVQLVDVRDARMGRDAEREFLQVSQAVREASREFCPQLQGCAPSATT